MSDILSHRDIQSERWAVSLCFSSAIIMGLEALHPGSCAWMGFDADQSFALSAAFATLSVFLGTFILTKRS